MIRNFAIRVEAEDLEAIQKWSQESGLSQQKLIYGILREALKTRETQVENYGVEMAELIRIVQHPADRAELLLSNLVHDYFNLKRRPQGERTDNER